MGVEYYVAGFHLGSPAGLSEREVLQCFQPQSMEFMDGQYRLLYDELNSCDMSLTEEHGEVVGVCIFRPCSHEGLDRDLGRLLAAGPYVLFMPGGIAPAAGCSGMRIHLPPDMLEAIGEPVVIGEESSVSSILFN